jgi:hypothetical protein
MGKIMVLHILILKSFWRRGRKTKRLNRMVASFPQI